MKKVSVQFNLVVDDNVTHSDLERFIKQQVAHTFSIKTKSSTHQLTSLEINNIDVTDVKAKKGKGKK